MRELLLQMDNERGLYLPFVLIITIIIFSTITTMIAIYKNEKLISNQLWEFMKAETIAEMTKQKLIEESFGELEENGYVTYSFPLGDVHVTYDGIDEHTYSLLLEIKSESATDAIFMKVRINQ